MTISEYSKKFKVKEKTVRNWINLGYIPKSDIKGNAGEGYIPSNARLPYTERGMCKGSAIYKSLIRAYSKGKNVVPSMYEITEEKYDVLHKNLLDWGFITEEILDGIIYYNATPAGMEFISWTTGETNRFIRQMISSISEGIATAVINYSIV